MLKKYGRYGMAVAASFAVAVTLLLVGPADVVYAVATSNNTTTTISLNTNVATGSSTFTTLPAITITCDGANMTPGPGNGTTGLLLRLSAGWTFTGGVAPTLAYDDTITGSGFTGSFTGVIESATTITAINGTACGAGDFLTITGVQVKPLTSTTAAGTITADIDTDVVVATLAITAAATPVSNNIQTTISLNTNQYTGSNVLTTLAPITITCGIVDITAGAANGVSGVTLRLDAGWMFGGAVPTITYAWGGGPTGDAVGTIVGERTITAAILASCDPGDVITFTGVQVKPLTAASAPATIIADINTADLVVARLATTPAAPLAVPVVVPVVVPPGEPVPAVVPVIVPEVCPPGSYEVLPPVVLDPVTGELVLSPVVVPPGTPIVCVLFVAPVGVVPEIVPEVLVPTPAATGNGGFMDSGSLGWPVLFLLVGVPVFAIATRRLVRVRTR